MRFFQLFFLTVFLAGCSSRENSDTSKHFFDFKEYFEKEAIRLQKENPVIEKTVSQNTQPEKKELKLSNWEAELELFTESDINKPAWQDSYRIVKSGLETQYVALDNDLKTKKILIRFSKEGPVEQVSILNSIKNALYSSSEQLDYFPDSLYRIKKHLDVRIIGTNSYSVTARFKKSNQIN